MSKSYLKYNLKTTGEENSVKESSYLGSNAFLISVSSQPAINMISRLAGESV